MFENKCILITGGTGSLGRALTNSLLNEKVGSIRILSRNERDQIQMEHELQGESRLRFLIGDIRDKERVFRAMEGVDVVFHTAAMKHVPKIEYNPFESIKTNVIGTQNVIDACHENKVEVAVGVSTDKAVEPLNVYGATKLLTEKLFVSASNYVDKTKHPTKFMAVRYGNVLGSSGSVVPKFIEQIKSKKKITITDPKMTRFTITMNEALDFIFKSVKESKGSDTFIPKIKAYNIVDVKDVLFEILGETEVEISQIRAGEKLKESLISQEEMRYTIENDENYIIPSYNLSENDVEKLYPNYKKSTLKSEYSSESVEKISKDELKIMISDLISQKKINTP